MKDKIITSEPVNKLTAIVVGKQPNEDMKNNYGHSYMSLERPPILAYHGHRHNDITGLVVGKLTIIGVFIKQRPDSRKSLKWVVQCLCGYYCVRKSSVLRKRIKDNTYDECIRCRNNHKNRY